MAGFAARITARRNRAVVGVERRRILRIARSATGIGIALHRIVTRTGTPALETIVAILAFALVVVLLSLLVVPVEAVAFLVALLVISIAITVVHNGSPLLPGHPSVRGARQREGGSANQGRPVCSAVCLINGPHRLSVHGMARRRCNSAQERSCIRRAIRDTHLGHRDRAISASIDSADLRPHFPAQK